MGLFGRKKDHDAPQAGGDARLDRVRAMALAGDDEGVERLLKQMDAEGVPSVAEDALDLGTTLWAVDENSLAAMFVLTTVAILDSAQGDTYLDANYYAGLALKDLEMEDMAISYLRISADLGMAKAQYMLSLSLEGAEFVKYIELAANQGYADAQAFIRDNPELMAQARSEAGNVGGLPSNGAAGSLGGLGSAKPGGSGLGGGGLGGGAGVGSAAPVAPATTGSRFCTSCGSQLASDARFCGGCGTPAA